MAKPKLKKPIAITFSLGLGLAITVFVTMLLFNVTDYGITIASFGATIFMILSRNNLSKRKIYGAYILATLCGYIFSRFDMMKSLNVSLAAFTSVALMTVLELQHAPAIGLSIAMVLNKFTLTTDLIVLMCILAILSMTILLKVFLKSPERVLNFIEIEEEKIQWKFKKREINEYLRIRAE